jgi:YggT family protein
MLKPETLMRAVLDIVLLILQLYWWVVLAMIIMSWLISFNVINTRNQFVEGLWRVLNQLTEPVLRPIRRVMPNFSGLDISPIILFIIIFFIERIIIYYIYPNVF